jgi:hypothetical protein
LAKRFLSQKGGFTVSVQSMFTTKAAFFVGSFILFRFTLLVQYIVVYVYHEEGRAYIQCNIIFQVVSILVYGISLVLPPQHRAILWIVGADPEFIILLQSRLTRKVHSLTILLSEGLN